MTKEEIKNHIELLLTKIKMTISQMEAKIQMLEIWLMENPNNSELGLIKADLNKLRTDLEKKKHD